MDKATEIKALIAAAFGFVTALIGWAGWLFLMWVLLLFVDWLTGSEAARMNGTWSSAKGKQGRQKKLGCFYMVLLAGVLDALLYLLSDVLAIIQFPWDYRVILLPVVLLWYILIDAGSIVENVALMGAPVPDWLARGIEKAQEAVDNGGDKIVDAIDNAITEDEGSKETYLIHEEKINDKE